MYGYVHVCIYISMHAWSHHVYIYIYLSVFIHVGKAEALWFYVCVTEKRQGEQLMVYCLYVLYRFNHVCSIFVFRLCCACPGFTRCIPADRCNILTYWKSLMNIFKRIYKTWGKLLWKQRLPQISSQQLINLVDECIMLWCCWHKQLL